jgi:hypothetical protein
VLAPAGAVLADRYSSDAHFVAYAADIPRRHTVALFKNPAHADKIKAVNLHMELFVADVDGPNHVCTDPWWDGERLKISELLAAHPGGFAYRTRGGYRIVYALPRPSPLRLQSEDDAWTARYLSWVKYLARRFAIVADEACADWTHFYRAPFVVRDGVRQELATIGDPYALGTWAPTLERADRVRAMKTPNFGEVEPIPIGDFSGKYAYARVDAARQYLERASLSIKGNGHGGRRTMFGVCGYLTRQLRLPIAIATECVDRFYNPRLAMAGTATWRRRLPSGRDPSEHGMSIEERLEKARDEATEIPPGDVPDEETWNLLNRIGEHAS